MPIVHVVYITANFAVVWPEISAFLGRNRHWVTKTAMQRADWGGTGFFLGRCVHVVNKLPRQAL
jgi:hypothetical protein